MWWLVQQLYPTTVGISLPGYAELLIRLGLAALLSAAIGFDRQQHAGAGLRTHMLVGLGAAALMIVSKYGFGDLSEQDHVSFDPSRIASLVVSGVGFIGAGTILSRHHAVHGLTTAASLWNAAAVGLASGSGLIFIALATAGLIVIVLVVIKPLEQRLVPKQSLPRLILITHGRSVSIEAIERALIVARTTARQLKFRLDEQLGEDRFEITLNEESAANLNAFVEQLRALPGIKSLNTGEP